MQPLAQRLRMAQLYAFADAHQVADLPGFVAAVVAGGADIVQVRLRGLTTKRRAELFGEVRSACRSAHVVLVVDDDLAVAAEAEADAVLIDADPLRARSRLHPTALVGRHASDAAALTAAGWDYAIVGPVRGSKARPGLIEAAVAAAPPAALESRVWFADGGITPANVASVLAAGARRIGVGTALAQSSDPQATARELVDAVAQAWADDPAMDAYRFALFDPTPRASFRADAGQADAGE